MKNVHWTSAWRRRVTIAVGLALAWAAGIGSAGAADPSDPVGVFSIRLRGNSDTIVSLPLQRAALVETTLAARSGSDLTLEADVPTLPTEGAFALIMSGALEGAVLPIASVSGRILTVDTTGFDLALLKTTTANGPMFADLVSIVPYWTLDTLFPAGRGIHISPNAAQRATEILVFDDTTPGINFSPTAVYFYVNAIGTLASGWYKVGNFTPHGTTRFSSHRYFVVRHRNAADTELLLPGGVQMAGFRLAVGTRALTGQQDNLVALPIATPVTLGASRLVESGAFSPSSNAAIRSDELLFFDNTAQTFNKSPSAVYFYLSGNSSLANGWYRVGDLSQPQNDVLLRPGEGYVVRKRTSPSLIRKEWNGMPAYLQ